MENILLVEDDPILARTLQVNLELESFSVTWANNLSTAFSVYEKAEPTNSLALVILDLGLPDGSGFDFVQRARRENSNLPIIILTAQSDEDSVVRGLQLGANDYMKKPFGNNELIARIKTVLRFSPRNHATAENLIANNSQMPRTENSQQGPLNSSAQNTLHPQAGHPQAGHPQAGHPQAVRATITFGPLSVNEDNRTVKFNEKTIALHRREFDILYKLVQRAESIVSREMILQVLDKEGEIFDRTVDSHVSHIRGKFRAAGVQTIKITSVYGLGYRLEKA